MPTKTAAKPSAKELQKEAKGLGIKGYEEMGLKDLRDAVESARSSKNGKATSKKSKSNGAVTADKIADGAITAAKITEEAPEKPSKAKKGKKTAPATKPATKAPASKKAAPGKKNTPAKATKARTPGGLGATKDSVRTTYPPTGVAAATEKTNPFRKGSNLFHVAPLLLKGGNREQMAKKLSDKIELHPYQKDVGTVDLLDYDKRLLLGAQTMRDKFGFGIVRAGRGIEGTIKVFVPGSSDDPATKAVSKNGKAGKASSKKG